MLDQDLKAQLEELLKPLESEVSLLVELSQHPDQVELLDLLEGVASTSKKIKVIKSATIPGAGAQIPRFKVGRGGTPTGIEFSGIPGGHEFSSLVLAILNADGKGKMPDEALRSRIRRLKGPVRLKTYVSLSCENCPDVVQALNQMALVHPDFKHEVIDGAYAQEEIQRLNIQGVPSVVVNDRLIHSGRIGYLELIEKLEKEFGVAEENPQGDSSTARDFGFYDVAVLGGGPAGVSAAIYTVRKGLKTSLIAEKMGGQVQETRGIENLIGTPYTEGPKLSADLAKHAKSYPIDILEYRRAKSVKVEDGSVHLTFEGGETLRAKSLIVTTGAKWRELNVPGEKEYIGRGVAFCPHCDGPYYKGKKVAVIGGGNSGVEAAIDLAGIVREVVLIEFNDKLKADQILVNKLQSLSNVTIITGAKTEEIIGDGKVVKALIYEDRATKDRRTIELDGVFVQIGLIPNSQFLKGVVDLTPFGEIIVDGKGRTSAPGIYAAGDVTTTPYKQIIIAMGEGAKAGLAVFEDQMLH